MRNVYELYINGKLCDLSSDESVSLVYQSGLFSELDAIQSNRSQNIDLPITPWNMSIIGMANRPDISSDAPYIKHSASLYQGGIALFVDGYAVITEITDEAISVVLTWGNVENFEPLFDANLRDLGNVLEGMTRGSGNCAHIDWNESSALPVPQTSPLQKVGFYGIDFGMGIATPQYVHPSVTVAAIIEAIEKYHGITIDGKTRLSPNLIVPCVSRNADDVSNKAEMMEATPHTSGWDSLREQRFSYPDKSIKLDTRHLFDDDKILAAGTKKLKIQIAGTNTDFTTLSTFAITMESEGKHQESGNFQTYLSISTGVKGGDSKEVTRFYASSQSPVVGNSFQGSEYIAYFNYQSITLDVENVEYVYISVHSTDIEFYPAKQTLPAKVLVSGEWDDVVYPSVFPIAPNLPDMSHGDFIAALLTLNGLFAYVDNATPNTIKLMSADEIFSNMQKRDVYDWSSRVLVNGRRRPDMPDSSQFTIDDYARSNSLDYDNDDDVKAETVGYINIENQTLDKEREMVSLGFSASDNAVVLAPNTAADGIIIAEINAYKQQENTNDDEIKVDYSEPSPRILSVINDVFYFCYGKFTDSQYFGGAQGIVATKYASLQKILDRFRLVTVRLRLTALDLYELDYRKPVYLSQFGQYFAIYKIETQANGVCECQLLQLRNE